MKAKAKQARARGQSSVSEVNAGSGWVVFMGVLMVGLGLAGFMLIVREILAAGAGLRLRPLDGCWLLPDPVANLDGGRARAVRRLLFGSPRWSRMRWTVRGPDQTRF